MFRLCITFICIWSRGVRKCLYYYMPS